MTATATPSSATKIPAAKRASSVRESLDPKLFTVERTPIDQARYAYRVDETETFNTLEAVLKVE